MIKALDRCLPKMWLCVLLCAPLVLMACADTVGVGAGVVNSPTAKFNYGQASSDDNATSINTPFQYKIGPDGSFSNDGASYLFNWRLAVFPLRVPSPPSDYLQPNADYSQNLHIAKTQFQLQWDTESRNKSLATYLAERNLSSISFAMVHMKANSTMLSAYSGQLDGDCTALLGRDCTLSLGSATNYVTRNLSSLSGCSSVFPSEAPKYRTWGMSLPTVTCTDRLTYQPLYRAQRGISELFGIQPERRPIYRRFNLLCGL